MPKVAVIYHSTHGHVKALADKIKEGAEEAGLQVDMYQVQETLSAEVLSKMGATPNPHPDPVFTYDHVEKLPDYDGFFFGFPAFNFSKSFHTCFRCRDLRLLFKHGVFHQLVADGVDKIHSR